MNIDFRDSNGKLYSKNILNIDLDMEVLKLESGKYVVKLTKKYVFDEEFDTTEEAEAQLKNLSDARNNLEREFKMEN